LGGRASISKARARFNIFSPRCFRRLGMNGPAHGKSSATLVGHSGPADWFRGASGRMRLKVGLVIVLGLLAFFTLILGVSTIVAEHQFGVRRERFRREGIPAVETVRGKKVGRRTRSLVIAPADSKPFAGEPGPGDGRWVRVHRPAFERYQVGDRVELLKIGDDYFVRDDEFHSRFSPPVCLIGGAIAAAAVVVVAKGWKIAAA